MSDLTMQLRKLGHLSLLAVADLGNLLFFALAAFRAALTPPLRFSRLLEELHLLGVLSIIVIALAGTTVGMVLGLQGYNTLVRFGAENALGAVVGLSLIRELGPVLTALLVAGRAGSATAAGIASMVATEQLDGLRMMSIDPIDLVVAPKLIGFILVMPFLTVLFVLAGLAGGWLVAVQLMGLDPGFFRASLDGAVRFDQDILLCLVKALVFGGIAGIVATYRGFHAVANAAGVSAATTSTVVTTSVTVLLADYVVTALWGFRP